jgi:hypothetical protein
VRGDWSLAKRRGGFAAGLPTDVLRGDSPLARDLGVLDAAGLRAGAVARTTGADARVAGADARGEPDAGRDTAAAAPEDDERRSPPRDSAATVAPARARLPAIARADRNVVDLMDTPLGRCESNRPASGRTAKRT